MDRSGGLPLILIVRDRSTFDMVEARAGLLTVCDRVRSLSPSEPSSSFGEGGTAEADEGVPRRDTLDFCRGSGEPVAGANDGLGAGGFALIF